MTPSGASMTRRGNGRDNGSGIAIKVPDNNGPSGDLKLAFERVPSRHVGYLL